MNKRAIDSQPGKRLLEIRQHRGISQGRIAKVLGVSVGTVQNYEHGRTHITTDRLEQLARALQCEPADLLKPPDMFGQIKRGEVCCTPRRYRAMYGHGACSTASADRITR